MSFESWEIADSSDLHFAVRHLLFSKVRGRFGRWSGTVRIPDGSWSGATVDAVIEASSIETGIAERDAHLRSAAFLDVGRYPEITFRTVQVTTPAAGRLRVLGVLTLKGRAVEVPLDVVSSGVTVDPSGVERAAFAARATIRRRDFGASGNLVWDHFGLMIGERIDIEIHVDALRQPAAAVAFLSDIHDEPVARR